MRILGIIFTDEYKDIDKNICCQNEGKIDFDNEYIAIVLQTEKLN